ncbi:NADH:flavin oxidoreductase [Caloramator sp. E03]|uniref:NAD(P)/FAD-dependent oxidoreductase n=1 Tax=Caloramator sp. E03 TaxID=2576307 RepID=UPI00111069CD|nr:NAD(P)/FAD-dependent oxidoreductase [Caloramator sp. E03]QCX34352.1 NADH:flavin oxidoreductase [Caloramator sp. E03]
MLFDSGKIGNIYLKNRFIMLPTVTNLACNGFVTDREMEYYDKRSKDVSLVIVEASYVNTLGKFFLNQLGIDNDDKIEGLNKLSNILHKNGSIAGIQLAMHNPKFKPEDFNIQEIKNFIEDFAQAAFRAKKAGFDLVELHFAHGWFVNNFLSPYKNNRNDEYGGSFEKRAKFALDILYKVKERVPNIAVSCRINVSDFLPNGFDIDESIKLSKMLEKYGADCISLSAGVGEKAEYHIAPMEIQDKLLVNLVRRIKENINIPIIAANKLGNFMDWEKILEDNVADFIGIARNLICDPDLISKIKNGKFEEIRYCIHCNQACIANILKGLPVSCLINPEVGRESEFNENTKETLKIAVIGGGPSGMSAAKYLAKKGHNVDLYEKTCKLGGQLNIAKVPPFKQKIGQVIDYLERDLKNLNVNIHLNNKMNIEQIMNLPHDKVIIATGSVPNNIENLDGFYFASDVLTGKMPKGKYIIVIGGGLTGIETAEYLAQFNKNVIILEKESNVLENVFPMTKRLILNRIKMHNIEIITNANIKNIDGNKLIYSLEGKEVVQEFDDIVVALGYKPDDRFTPLKNNKKYIFIGDCNNVASAVEAIRDGFELALKFI